MKPHDDRKPTIRFQQILGYLFEPASYRYRVSCRVIWLSCYRVIILAIVIVYRYRAGDSNSMLIVCRVDLLGPRSGSSSTCMSLSALAFSASTFSATLLPSRDKFQLVEQILEFHTNKHDCSQTPKSLPPYRGCLIVVMTFWGQTTQCDTGQVMVTDSMNDFSLPLSLTIAWSNHSLWQ